jgi:hypothetical protein
MSILFYYFSLFVYLYFLFFCFYSKTFHLIYTLLTFLIVSYVYELEIIIYFFNCTHLITHLFYQETRKKSLNILYWFIANIFYLINFIFIDIYGFHIKTLIVEALFIVYIFLFKKYIGKKYIKENAKNSALGMFYIYCMYLLVGLFISNNSVLKPTKNTYPSENPYVTAC